MSLTTLTARGRPSGALPVVAFAVILASLTLTAAPAWAAPATPAAPTGVAATPSPTSSSAGLSVTLDGNPPILTPGGDPAQFTVTLVNHTARRLTGVRVDFNAAARPDPDGGHPEQDGQSSQNGHELRVDVADLAANAGWRPVTLTPTPTGAAYSATLSPTGGLSVPAHRERQVRFRIALAAAVAGQPDPSQFQIAASTADGRLRGSVSRDYAVRPSLTSVSPSLTNWSTRPGPHRRHALVNNGDATTTTVAVVVAVAAVLGIGGVVFGLGTRRRRRAVEPS